MEIFIMKYYITEVEKQNRFYEKNCAKSLYIYDRRMYIDKDITTTLNIYTDVTKELKRTDDIMAAVRSLIFIGKVRKDPTTRVRKASIVKNAEYIL